MANWLILIGTLAAGLGALDGAWAAWRAATAARDAVRMQILLDFAKRDAGFADLRSGTSAAGL